MIKSFFPLRKLRRNGRYLLFVAVLVVGAFAAYLEFVATNSWNNNIQDSLTEHRYWRPAVRREPLRHYSSEVGEEDQSWRSNYKQPAWRPEYKGQANLHIFEDWCGSSTNQLRKNLHYPLYPHSRTTVKKLAVSPRWTNYGLRVFGFLHPHTDGEFLFAVASDDNCELWLSDDESPDNLQILAYTGKMGSEWTAPGEFGKYASQTSEPILLQREKRYFFELIHKQNDRGTDHVEVAWRLNHADLKFTIIDSKYISLYTNESSLKMSDVDHIPQTAASHVAPPRKSPLTPPHGADMLRDDPRDSAHLIPLIDSSHLKNVLPDCYYKPSYIIKGFPLLRYQGLQFVHLSYVYPNDYTRLTHMENENTCFYHESPRYLDRFGFSKYMRMDRPENEDAVLRYRGAGVGGRREMRGRDEEESEQEEQEEEEGQEREARSVDLPDYGDDYDDYTLQRRRKLFSLRGAEVPAPRNAGKRREDRGGNGAGPQKPPAGQNRPGEPQEPAAEKRRKRRREERRGRKEPALRNLADPDPDPPAKPQNPVVALQRPAEQNRTVEQNAGGAQKGRSRSKVSAEQRSGRAEHGGTANQNAADPLPQGANQNDPLLQGANQNVADPLPQGSNQNDPLLQGANQNTADHLPQGDNKNDPLRQGANQNDPLPQGANQNAANWKPIRRSQGTNQAELHPDVVKPGDKPRGGAKAKQGKAAIIDRSKARLVKLGQAAPLGRATANTAMLEDTKEKANMLGVAKGKAAMLGVAKGKAAMLGEAKGKAAMLGEAKGKAAMLGEAKGKATMLDRGKPKAGMLDSGKHKVDMLDRGKHKADMLDGMKENITTSDRMRERERDNKEGEREGDVADPWYLYEDLEGDEDDLFNPAAFDPEVNWGQTFQVTPLDLDALRSDWIELHCNVSGNLLLSQSDVLPVVQAFMDKLNQKKHRRYSLLRVLNVEKRADGLQGSRYLLELELQDREVGGRVRVAQHVYLLRGRSRPRALGRNQDLKPLLLCNPRGFQWNPTAMVHFIIPVKNQARWVQQLIVDMEALYRATADSNFNIIITDYSSTDMDIEHALKTSSLPRYQYLRLSGNFERSAGLQAGIDLISDNHSIVFLCDLHISFPASFLDSVRQHCVEGHMAFAPIVLRLNCGATPQEPDGFWEVNGFGLLGIYKSDLAAAGGMNTQDFRERWGGEDWELLDRILQAGLEVERVYLRNFLHHYHSKRGMWNRQTIPAL